MYTSSQTSSSKLRSILLFDLDADSFVKFAHIEADVSYTDTILLLAPLSILLLIGPIFLFIHWKWFC